MATVAGQVRGKPVRSLAADAYEKVLAIAATVLLVTVLVAIMQGHAYWFVIPAVVWAHLLPVIVALALTPVMLLRPRGDTVHRLLGKLWVAAMFLTAFASFFVRLSNHGGFSFIHILSTYVVIAAPLIWWTAATHRVAAHRRQVRAMTTGALVIAGFFTLPFGRMLGQWLLL